MVICSCGCVVVSYLISVLGSLFVSSLPVFLVIIVVANPSPAAITSVRCGCVFANMSRLISLISVIAKNMLSSAVLVLFPLLYCHIESSAMTTSIAIIASSNTNRFPFRVKVFFISARNVMRSRMFVIMNGALPFFMLWF